MTLCLIKRTNLGRFTNATILHMSRSSTTPFNLMYDVTYHREHHIMH